MFPAEFEYLRADSVADALRLLGEHPDAKLLAGGHSLLPMMKLRLAIPEALIDIGRIADLRGADVEGDHLRIGALTTHDELATSELIRVHAPLIAEAASKIADPAVRNRGTIGGNIAHADPASDLPAVLLALGATIHLTGADGERTVAAADFFTGLLETDLGDGEILTAVVVPAQGPGSGAAYLKLEHPASGYAICGAAAVVQIEADRVVSAALAFNGVTAIPHLATAVGDAFQGGPPDNASIKAAVENHLRIEDPLGDLQASGEYRAAMALTYGRRALKLARDRALA